MELRHLRYFAAVAQELNFRRAAERLHLAQPSLSRQVRDLEEEIGARLLERDRRQVALTEAGRVLLKEVPRLLAEVAAAIEATREAGRVTRGTLRIGNVGVLSASFLPGSLAAFHQRFPQAEVEILELGMDEQVAALLAGKIQVGFQARTQRTPVDSRLTEQTVLTCGLTVALPTSHPLTRERRLSLRSLAGERLLHLEPRPGAGYDRWVRALCEQAGGFTPRFRRPAADNLEALLGLVAADKGVAILAELATRELRGGAGFVIKTLHLHRSSFQVVAVWNPALRSATLNSYLSVLSQQTAPTIRRQRASGRKARALTASTVHPEAADT